MISVKFRASLLSSLLSCALAPAKDGFNPSLISDSQCAAKLILVAPITVLDGFTPSLIKAQCNRVLFRLVYRVTLKRSSAHDGFFFRH